MTALVENTLPLTRNLFAWASTLVLGLALASTPSYAQTAVHSGHSASDHDRTLGLFVLRAGPGGILCEEADDEDLQALSRSSSTPLNLTVVPSTNAPSEITGMRILLRATDQLLEFPEALLAFRRSAARWERAITSPITVVIDVDYGPERFDSGPYGPNVLGSANSAAYFIQENGERVGPQAVVDALKARHVGDDHLQALYDAIPVPAPSTAGSDLGFGIGALANLQALGFFPAHTDPDPLVNPFGDVANIGFNSAFDFDFEPADGISAGQFDFEGVAVHEIGHALGFNSIIGNGGPPNNLFYVWDLFRVRPEAVEPGEDLFDGEGWETAPRVTTPGPPNSEVLVTEGGVTYYKPVQVFFDGFNEYEVSTATGGRQGGDGQQASHWRDDALRPPSLGEDRKIGIMDPNLGTGSRDEYNSNDLRMLEVIGYNVLYAPPLTDASVTVDGQPYDVTAPDSLVFMDLGDADIGATLDLNVALTNLGAEVALDYSAEVDLEVAYPADAEPTLSLNSSGGSIAPGASETLTLSAGAAEPSAFYGTLRIETNVDSMLVFEVPFRLSVGGATAPKLALSTDEIGSLGDFPGDQAETKPLVTISNSGNLGLDYQTATSLVTTNPFAFDTTPDAPRMAGVAPLYENDFADGTLGDFTAGGSFPGDWQVVGVGPDTLGGHSRPNSAYFGQTFPPGDSLQYRNQATGILISPSLDLSAVPQQDLVVLTFSTYLQAEVGYDFATVLISLDDGETYQKVATSDGGILQNTTAWESVMIELPLLASYPEPVRFAFEFTSDGFVTDVGWFIDDVVLTTRPDENPVYVTPVAGTLGEDGSQELTLTIQGGQVERGYYRGAVQIISNSLEFSEAGVPLGFTDRGVRVLEVSKSVPFTLTVGDPAPPVLAVAAEPPVVTVSSDSEATGEVEVTNVGEAPVTFIRVLEPALSSFLDPAARSFILEAPSESSSATRPEALALSADLRSDKVSTAFETSRSVVADEDSLFSIVLPGASSNISGITQLPDGRVIVADLANNGRTYVLSENLSAIEATLDGLAEGTEQVAGVAYNDETGTLWYAISTGQLREATLGETAVESTGRSFDIDFAPGGIAYSSTLGAFFIPERQTSAVYAVDAAGTVLPGYPVEAPSRGGIVPGLSVTNGVVELLNEFLSYVQLDQFGRPYDEGQEIVVPSSLLGGSARINGLLRSKTDPDGVLYYVTRPGGGVVRVVGVDPVDLPAYTNTLVEAGEPLYGVSLEPQAMSSLALRVAPAGREPGMYTDTLAFLTNNPGDRILRIPIGIEVTPSTATEEGAAIPGVFAVHQNYPNPFAGETTLKFDLPTSARATLTVYNVLGQRVAVLFDDEVLEAGAHVVPFDARSLASGTYVVRLVANDFAGSKRITLVR